MCATFPKLEELPGPGDRQGWPWTFQAPPAPLPPGGAWPRITIVTPSFNQGRFLEETLRSVLLQSYPELEYIVVDGGSSDGSVEILRRYGPWLGAWTSAPDRGQSDAINRGFECARGEIVTFLASDDVYEPGAFHDVARRFMEQPGCGAIVGAFRFMDESSRRLEGVHPPRLPGPGSHDLALLEPRCWRLHQVSTFYSRAALDAVGRYVREDLHYTMDRELLYRVCRRFPVVLAEPVYAAFRRHPASKSVAMILPMSEEMARLHLLDVPANEEPGVHQRRRALARERRGRGYLKLANSGVRRRTTAAALLRAPRYDPRLLVRRYYYKSWLAVCGLLPFAERLYRFARRRRATRPSRIRARGAIVMDRPNPLNLGSRAVGPGHPSYVIAEIGINHNGDLDLAKKLIDAAAEAGCDAVKFQKRTPELCVPVAERARIRETPWGTMSYMEYRERVEFGRDDYVEIDRYCRQKKIAWLASCWDVPSVDFIEQFEPVCYKVASASLTDHDLLCHLAALGRPVILSTGMSTMDEIRQAVDCLDLGKLILLHCTSSYPCAPEELNLRMIPALAAEFPCPIGYSGHEVGLQTTVAVVALGAAVVERHITLDRSMWGSDQAASVEPWGFMRLVRDIRVVERALGDGRKRVYESETPLKKRLRR